MHHAGADGGIVERAGDLLAPALAQPVRRPQRDLAGIRYPHRVLGGTIADRAGDGLRVKHVGRSIERGLFVQHRVPLRAVGIHRIEKGGVASLRQGVEQHAQGRAHRSDDAEGNRGAATQREGAFVDLHHTRLGGEELGIGVVGP